MTQGFQSGAASAPGKLFLTGEYAVLEGAPAILAPVPHRAKASLGPAAKGKGGIHITAAKAMQMPIADLDKAPLVQAVVEAAQSAGASPGLKALLGGKARLAADTAAFHAGDKKLGLGGSAAIAVALLRCLCPDLDKPALLPLAQQAHKRFQQGRGSGADIALSLHEEPIVFEGASVRPACLPQGLQLLCIWTGKPSSSAELLRKLAAFAKREPKACRQAMQRLAEAAASAAQALPQGTQDFLLAVQQYGQSLLEFSEATGLGFYSAPHLALRKQVESAACIYKPSGAGGGDFGIAFAASHEPIAALQAQLAGAGLMNFLCQPRTQET